MKKIVVLHCVNVNLHEEKRKKLVVDMQECVSTCMSRDTAVSSLHPYTTYKDMVFPSFVQRDLL